MKISTATIFIASKIKRGCLYRQRNKANRSTMVDMAGYIMDSILCKTTCHILTHGRQEEPGKLILFLSLFSPTTLSLLLFFPIFISFNFFHSFFVCLPVFLHLADLFLPLFVSFLSYCLSIFVSSDVCSSERTAKKGSEWTGEEKGPGSFKV